MATKALNELVYFKYDQPEKKFNLLLESSNFPNSITSLHIIFKVYTHRSQCTFYFTNWPSSFENDPSIPPRTNNAIEGWYNTFAGTFCLCKHSFYSLIKELKGK